jgi:bifunctional non-homologous end joining protein LigD
VDGVIAKRTTSRYEPGLDPGVDQNADPPHEEVIIAGWSPSTSNPKVLGALLLAAHDETGKLVYVGDVGAGFTDAARRHLRAQLQPLEQPEPPFPGAFARARGWPGRPPARGPIHWVHPRIDGEIHYRLFTADGYFRHPSWRGLRPDQRNAELCRPAVNLRCQIPTRGAAQSPPSPRQALDNIDGEIQ